MESDLLHIAGGDPAPANQLDQDCVATLAAAVQELKQRGKTANAIVSALAAVSLLAIDQQQRQ